MATLVRHVKCFRGIAVNSVKLLYRHEFHPIDKSIRLRLLSTTSSLWHDRKFSDKHEWVTVNGNVGTIGISNYAQEALGDIVYAQLPDPEAEFDRDDDCGALESVKAASELYSPVSGTVTEKNTEVEEKPALINESCYEKGWLFKIELANMDELDDLMTEDQYEAFLKSESDE